MGNNIQVTPIPLKLPKTTEVLIPGMRGPQGIPGPQGPSADTSEFVVKSDFQLVIDELKKINGGI